VEPHAPSTGWQPLAGGLVRRAKALTVPRTAKEDAFLRLALTHTLVAGGDAMVTVALAGSIFFTTDPNQARLKLIFALVLTMAPFAVVAPFLGPAIDRSKGGRRAMLVVSSAGRCATCLYMATVLHSVLLYPCALVLLILAKGHAVAKSSLVPATVDHPGDLVKAGGRLAVLAAAAAFIVGGPAAAILKLAGAPWVLRVAAVVYAAGAVAALRTRRAPPAAMDPADHVDEAARSRGVSLAVTCQAAIRACSGFLTFAVAFVFRRGHAPTWWYGVVVVFALLGGFVGNFAGPGLRRLFGEERILTVVLVCLGATGLVAARLDSRPGLTLLAFAAGLADGIGQLAFDAIVQRDGSEGTRGRSFARFEATFQLMWVGAALLPVILPIRNWVACLMIALTALGAAVSYVVGRQTRTSQTRTGPARGAEARTGVPDLPGFTPVPSVVADIPVPRAGGPGASPAEPPPDPGIWSAVRAMVPMPAPAPYDEPTPPLGTPPVPGGRWEPGADGGDGGGGAPAPGDGPLAGSGPRRNPRRAGGRRR